ncbi:hypothetical protein HY631_04670 [Candidatus Uhrbacteria bacterium]|nr:hypothetical protein [Candidatus Uhrbacteria bacterium]
MPSSDTPKPTTTAPTSPKPPAEPRPLPARVTRRDKAEIVKGEVVAPLPGEKAVDKALVDQVVAHVNRVASVKGMETVLEIGAVVLDKMFDGDPANFRRRGEEHLSFRELASRNEAGELHVSHSFIWRAVSVLEQYRLLPETVRAALPYTHHTLLLPVKDEAAKVQLAQRAAEAGWSKRKLEEEVQKVRAKAKGDSKAGRPPLPRFVKAIHRFQKLLVTPDETFGDLDRVDQLTEDEAAALYQAVTGMKLRCEKLQQALQVKVPGFAARQ